eukprot:scaffold338_cov116-Cylindrotheca_fusiformis.AAC.18
MSKRMRRAVAVITIVVLSLMRESNLLNQVESPQMTQAESVPEYYSPRVCKANFEATWIMFIGDSNTRHTYFWWTKPYQQDKRTSVGGATFGKDRRDLGVGGRWADQELLYNAKSCKGKMDPLRAGCNGPSVVRFSFRFLHGWVDELVKIPRPWDVARIGTPPPESQNEIDAASDIYSNWTGSGRPSDYAIATTRHKIPVDNNSTKFNRLMKEWKKKKSPDIVILTHGWRGMPNIDHADIVKAIVRENPDTLFVWAPMYISDRSPERYESFVEAGAFQWSGSNLHMVDLWKFTKLLPYSKDETSTYHAPTGGTHMKKCMKLLWAATKCRKYNG